MTPITKRFAVCLLLALALFAGACRSSQPRGQVRGLLSQTSVEQGTSRTVEVRAGEVLTVTADAGSSGSVVRLADTAGGDSQGVTAVSTSESKTFGPYASTARFDIKPAAGSLSYSTGPVVGENTGILRATRVLTDAEIKALPSTPIEIVPAPGAGKAIVPLAVIVSTPDWASGYGNINSTGNEYAAVLFDNNPGTQWMTFIHIDFTSLFSSGESTLVLRPAGQQNGAWGENAANALPGTALSFYVDNASGGDFTTPEGEDTSANTMTVTVLYVIVDLT